MALLAPARRGRSRAAAHHNPNDDGTRLHSALGQGGIDGGIARRTVADFPIRLELDFGGLFRVADGVAALRCELDDSIRVRNPLNPADAGGPADLLRLDDLGLGELVDWLSIEKRAASPNEQFRTIRLGCGPCSKEAGVKRVGQTARFACNNRENSNCSGDCH